MHLRGRDAAVATAVLGVGWVIGLTVPTTPLGAVAWSLAVLGVLYGLGAAVRRALRIELSPGELLVTGGVAWITLTGPLIALGVCSRVPMLVLAALATAAAVHDLATRDRPTRTRPDTTVMVLWALLAAVVLVELVGLVATRSNPFDDQIAYTAFVKRLLDCGNLIEPFSYRRVSAYGGQTSLLALAALRGDVQSSNLLDQGIFQWIAILVVIDLACRRKLRPGVIAVVVALVLAASDLSINSAATWTGFAMFAAAYGFASRTDLPRRTALLLAFATCAAACTLRQNYLLPAGLFAALLLVAHVREHAAAGTWRRAIHDERATIGWCVAIVALILVPYMAAAWRSNHTFLYPLLLGTMNPAAPLRPSGATGSDELAFFVRTVLSSDPIRIWWLLVPFMILAKDRRPLRPWRAMLIASAVGLLFMVHSFMLSDAASLWRYAYGYMTPLAVIFVLEIAPQLPMSQPAAEAELRLDGIATLLVWFALVAQLAMYRPGLADRLELDVHRLRAAESLGSAKPADAAGYRAMQAAVPAGARVAVLVDDPYLLDYARNPIFNLDLPGFAAPPPGLPSFLGAERWRSYLAGLGIRYVAYVRTEDSSYLYRRDSWRDRMFTQGELWRFMGAHMVDTIDTLAALRRTSQVLYDEGGLVVIDLGAAAAPTPPAPAQPELVRQDRFMREVSEHELGNDAWQLASRSTVIFEPDGLGPGMLQLEQRRAFPASGRLAALAALEPETPPFRYLSDRTRVRVHGVRRQHYRIRLWADLNRLDTTPAFELVIDGVVRGRVRAGADGSAVFDGDATCHGWCDLYIVASSISDFWLPPDLNQTIKLLGFQWDEVP